MTSIGNRSSPKASAQLHQLAQPGCQQHLNGNNDVDENKKQIDEEKERLLAEDSFDSADRSFTDETDTTATTVPFEVDQDGITVIETKTERAYRVKCRRVHHLVLSTAIVIVIAMLAMALVLIRSNTTTTVPPARSADSLLMEQQVKSLVQARLPSVSFNAITSPESKALDWIANVQTINTTAFSQDELIQRFAMAALHFGAGSHQTDSWLTSEVLCDSEYVGITVECHSDGSVSQVSMIRYDHSAPGELPVSMGLLTTLESLFVTYSDASGRIPTEIGLLTRLTDLYLSHNRLSGTIPRQIWSLTNMRSLALGGNKLTGTLPTEIGWMTDLRYLSLGANKLNGTIPSEIGNLPYLFIVEVDGTGIVGPAPPTFCSRVPNPLVNCENIDCSCCRDFKGDKCHTGTP